MQFGSEKIAANSTQVRVTSSPLKTRKKFLLQIRKWQNTVLTRQIFYVKLAIFNRSTGRGDFLTASHKQSLEKYLLTISQKYIIYCGGAVFNTLYSFYRMCFTVAPVRHKIYVLYIEKMRKFFQRLNLLVFQTRQRCVNIIYVRNIQKYNIFRGPLQFILRIYCLFCWYQIHYFHLGP